MGYHIAQGAYVLIGLGVLYLFADFLSCVYQDFADYCESIVEDKEREFTHEVEVDVDPDTGQRSVTIINK